MNQQPASQDEHMTEYKFPLPCPFCGTELIDSSNPDEAYEWHEGYYVHKKVEGCPFSEYEFDGLPVLWNQRVPV